MRPLLLLAAGAGVWAQAPSASITGTTSDQSQAVMGGVRVTAEETRTGVKTEVRSNEAGVYNFPSLAPGRYRVSAAAEGFQQSAFQDVVLDIGARLRLNFTLEPGSVSTVVEVAATNESLVNTIATSIGGVVTGQKVLSLPVVSRNALGFVSLQAGVLGGNFSGARIGALNISVDGINVQDNRINSGIFSPLSASIDIIEEFRVVTSPADAEFGRGSGQVQARTRSGTNEIHGSVFQLHRNTVLNANTWFNNQRGQDASGNPISPRNILILNNFGGRIGGPIRRNKTFYHINYEGFRSATRAAVNTTVLTQEARAGRFRYFPGVRNGNTLAAVPTVDLSGNPVQPAGAGGPLQTVNLFQFDAARSQPDPTGTTRRFLNYTPLPNNYRLGDGLNTAGFTWSRNSSTPSDLFRGKIDHHFNDRHRAELSWQRESDETRNGFQAQSYPQGPGGKLASWTHFASLGIDSVLTPRVLNQFRAGFNRPWVRFYSPWELGDDILPRQDQQRFLPVFTSFTAVIPNQDPQGRISPVYQFSDSLSITSGRHTFKGGFEVRFVSTNGFNSFDVVPRANIGAGILPAGPITAITGIGQNSALALSILHDLTGTLASKVQAFNATGGTSPQFVPGQPRQRTWRQREYSWFFKDDWKIRRSLTLNLGARWEYYGVPWDALGRTAALRGGSGSIFGISGRDFGAMFRPGVTPGSLSQVELIGRGSPNPSRSIMKPDRNNFAPAAGFSWQLPGLKTETVLRGGYGWAYERNSLRNLDVYAADVPGLRSTINFRSGEALNFANMPILAPQEAPLATVPLTDRAQTMYAWDDNLVTPYIQNWNVSLTRRLPGKATLDVRYVGSKGTRLLRASNINEVNIFENGVLDSYLAVQSGGSAPLFDNALRGLNFGGFGVVDGSPGRTGSDAIRFVQPASFANNAAATVASYLNTTVVGSPGGILRRAGLPENFVVANPQFGTAYLLGNFSNSSYHAMQVEVLKELSHGLEFQANWTWGRTIGEEEGETQDLVNSFRTNRNRQIEKRLLAFHRTHVFRSNLIYMLPFKGKGVSGWEVSFIFNKFSGEPLGFYSGRASFNNFTADNTADAAAAINPHAFKVKVGGSGVEYFEGLRIVEDPYRSRLTNLQRVRETSAMFAIADANGNLLLRNPVPGTIGNLNDAVFFGPGSFRFDLRIGKRFKIAERKDLQFYIDAENATNSPNWGNPVSTINTATFGRITSAGGTRILAVNGRFNF
ncbi:MAG: carboxypeptidase regulatory-like domain-containing protein [Acidobacteria bacterium]|nr:carboxypeptidase regulatory-like domain-containing protein [Acidobacteriota bacterium]